MLGGTTLDVVSVVDFAVVVVVVDGAALFPLFLRNHAQDHLAHLEQRMIKDIGEKQTQSKRKYISTSSLSATTKGLQWPQIFLEKMI